MQHLESFNPFLGIYLFRLPELPRCFWRYLTDWFAGTSASSLFIGASKRAFFEVKNAVNQLARLCGNLCARTWEHQVPARYIIVCQSLE
jgi:hypothetical protein